MKSQITELEEIIVSSKKINKELVIGKFKKSKINHYFSCGRQPWISARFFNYKTEYKETPYLNKIKVLTKSNIKDAKFNIRLYDIHENGEPENYIYDQNIIGVAKQGKSVTEIDLSELDIKFPEKGFFIAIEWLIIEGNTHKYTYKMYNSKKELSGVAYEPSIGTIPSETDKNSWFFIRGKWRKVWQNNSPSKKFKYAKKYKNNYSLIAIELSLSN